MNTRLTIRLTLFTAALVVVAVGGWFLSTAAHSVTPAPGPLPPEPIAKCKCIPKSDLVIRSWQAGQADALKSTFVTNEETKCDLYVLISYRDRADEYICPKFYTWEKTSMSHGFVFAKQPEWIFSNFVLDATATGPKHTFVAHPQNVEKGTNGRDNKPMKIEIRFSAVFECLPACAICPSSCPYANSSSGRRVERNVKKDLEQDGIDQMRQEYVDHRTIDVTQPKRI
ncbi:MAG: hypothetical protein OXT69_10775 [Candidatus Poribacteria bacterium]|nr:hypothetical protein [Candidatus Poribacteria bacterium]